MARRNVDVEPLVAAMKHAGAALRDAEIRFALAGGLAIWARGGAVTDHDVDFLVKPEDAERALQVLTDAGMRPERPPEDWLLKAYHDDTLVDLIFAPAGGPVTDELLDRAEEREVMAMRLPVSSMEDVLTTKLLALTEQEPNYASVLEVARTLREQIVLGRGARANLELTVREGVLHADRGARHPPHGGTHGFPRDAPSFFAVVSRSASTNAPAGRSPAPRATGVRSIGDEACRYPCDGAERSRARSRDCARRERSPHVSISIEQEGGGSRGNHRVPRCY